MQWNQSGSGTHTLSNPDQCQGKEGNDLKQRYGGIKIQNKAGGRHQTQTNKNPERTFFQVEEGGKAQSFSCLRTHVIPACVPSCRMYQTLFACLMLLWQYASFFKILN